MSCAKCAFRTICGRRNATLYCAGLCEYCAFWHRCAVAWSLITLDGLSGRAATKIVGPAASRRAQHYEYILSHRLQTDPLPFMQRLRAANAIVPVHFRVVGPVEGERTDMCEEAVRR